MQKFQTLVFLLCLITFTLSLQQLELSPISKTKLAETLTLGQPLTGFATEDAYQYYVLNIIPNPFPANLHLIFTSTPFTGDCDIYISTTTTTPNINNYDWKDDTMGGVIVEFNKTHPKFKEGGPYYIGIHGYTNTSFAVEAHVSGEHIIVTDGIPQHSIASRSEYQYYVFNQTAPGRIIISLTSVSGDPDLFVSTKTQRPDWGNYEWAHTDWGTDYLIITPGNVATYYIGVYGYDRAVYNMLLSHYMTVSLLMEGSPIVDYSEGGQYRYFKFVVYDRRGIDVVVNRLRSAGDPDLYLSTRFERPNQTHHDWVSANYGDDHITVHVTDPKFKYPAWYYASVYGYSTNVLYSVRWSHEDGHIQLVAGKSTTGIFTVPDKYHYYRFTMPTPRNSQEQLEISCYTTFGKVAIWSSMTEQYPSPSSFDRRGTLNGNSLTITYETPLANRVYYIAVLAEQASNYTIVASPSTHFYVLKDGESHSYYTALNDIRFFYFDVEEPSLDVSISIRSVSGVQQLYMSTLDVPTPSFYNWTVTTNWWSATEINVSPSHPARKPSGDRFYIAVYGKSSYNWYTITASVSNTTIEVRDGQIISGNVELNKYRYYKYYVRNSGLLNINLKALLRRGDEIADPDLYVSRIVSKPTQTNYQWRAINYGDDHLTFSATNGYYYIAVHGSYWPFEGAIPFELRINTEYDTLQQDGESIFGYVAKGQYKYFVSPFWWRASNDDRFAAVTLISGATELYANDNVTRPMRGASKYSDQSWPGNSLTMKDTLNYGTYTLAVYGVVESEFFIHMSNNEIQGYLSIGQPKLGQIKKGANYYRIRGGQGHITKRDYQLNVNLVNVNVFPPFVKIYVSQTIAKPNATHNTWNANNDGYQNIHMILDKEKMLENRDIYVTVESLEEEVAKVRLLFVIPGEPYFLTQDQPQQREIAANSTGLYSVLKARESEYILVVIESCDNTPVGKVYASTTNYYPDASNYEIASTSVGTYAQVISNSSLGMDKRYYYVQTERHPKRTVSVYATTLNDMRPKPIDANWKNLGLVDRNALKIVVPSIVATEFHPILYMVYSIDITGNNVPQNMETPCSIMENADLIGVHYQTTWVPSFTTDIIVTSHRTYLINVVAMNRLGITTAYLAQQVVVTNKDSLLLGKPIYTSVNETQYDQFVIDKVTLVPGDQLVIALTPLSGDIDLFVSMSAPATRENNVYNATFPGAKLLYIDERNQRGPGPYYVGVYGYTDSTFTIVAYLVKQEAIELVDGRPQISHVDREKWIYFKWPLNDNSNFTLSLTPISGDPDIYVSHLTNKPDRQRYQWYSASPGLDILKISSTMRDYAPNKDYYIGVFGWTDSIFSMVVTKEQTSELLTENLPHGQVVEYQEHKPFKFMLSTKEDLIVNVAPYYTWGNGDPDLCITTRAEKPISPKDCMWISQNYGEDTITIETTDPKWTLGWYYISVEAYGLTPRENLKIVISATTSYHDEVLLRDGVPKNILVTEPAVDYQYFKFYYGFEDPQNHLTFTALPTMGKVELYVADQENSKPTSERHLWKGISSSGAVQVKLPDMLKKGWYYCGAKTFGPSNYTITASTNQVAIELLPGYNLYSTVPHDFYKQFFVSLPNDIPTTDLVIMIRAYNGDPDLYVSNLPRATKQNYRWKSESSGVIDYVLIRAADLTGIRALFIGVYGYATQVSAFTVTFYRAGASVPLLDAHPAFGTVKKLAYQYYTYELPAQGRVKFTMQVYSPAPNFANLYVSKGRIPSLIDYDYRATSDGVAKFSISVPRATSGTWYLGVYGVLGDNITFSVTASTEFEYLEDGMDIRESVEKGQVKSFKVNVRREAPSVMISVTLINGNTEMMVNSNSTLPTRDWNMWRTVSYPGNSLFIGSSDRRFATGEWSISVFGSENSNFLISAQTAHGLLKRGSPRSGIIYNNNPVYYSIPVPYSSSAMFVLVKAFDKSCVRILADHEMYPTESAKWKADSRNVMKQAILRISKEETSDEYVYVAITSCGSNSTLQVEQHRFEISYATDTDPFYIMHDYTTIYQLGKYRRNAWFELLSDSYASSLNLFLESCESSPVGTVYLANSSATFPITENNADLVSNHLNAYQTVIKSKPLNDQLKLSVDFPNSDAIYSVYAVTKPDPRPNCTALTFITTNLPNPTPYKKAYQLEIPRIFSQFYPLKLEIMLVTFESKTQNAHTVCALRTSAKVMNTIELTNPEPVKTTIELDQDRAFYVNVLLTDSMGRTSTCSPVQIGVNLTILGVSVGGIIIMIAIIFIICYLVIGMCVKKFKYKATGLNLIPNIAFWKDVPFLIGDGILFMLTCGRKTRIVTKFDEITETIQAETSSIDGTNQGEGYNEIK